MSRQSTVAEFPPISATKLAVIVDLSERQVSRIMALHEVPKVHAHGYEHNAAFAALVTHYKDLSENLDEATKAHKAAIIANERWKSDREREALEGDWIPTKEVIQTQAPVASEIKKILLGSSLSSIEREEVLKSLVRLSEIDWVERAKQTAEA